MIGQGVLTSLARLSMSAIVRCFLSVLSGLSTLMSMWLTVLGLLLSSSSFSVNCSGNQSSKNLTFVAFFMLFSYVSPAVGLMWLYFSGSSSLSCKIDIFVNHNIVLYTYEWYNIDLCKSIQPRFATWTLIARVKLFVQQEW